MERLGSIDKRYKELLELNKTRKQRLLDALSLYKLFNEADAVDAWIKEKEKFLHTIVPSKDDMEELEVMRHRFGGFDCMRLSALRVNLQMRSRSIKMDLQTNICF